MGRHLDVHGVQWLGRFQLNKININGITRDVSVGLIHDELSWNKLNQLCVQLQMQVLTVTK